MAIIPYIIERGSKSTSNNNGGHGGPSRGPSISIPGVSIGVILGVMLVIFIGTFIYYYLKARKVQKRTGEPIPVLRIIGKCLLIACSFGVALAVISACTNGNGATVDRKGHVHSNDPPMQQETAYVGGNGYQPVETGPTETMETSSGPGMWNPIHGAATAPIQ